MVQCWCVALEANSSPIWVINQIKNFFSVPAHFFDFLMPFKKRTWRTLSFEGLKKSRNEFDMMNNKDVLIGCRFRNKQVSEHKGQHFFQHQWKRITYRLIKYSMDIFLENCTEYSMAFTIEITLPCRNHQFFIFFWLGRFFSKIRCVPFILYSHQ